MYEELKTKSKELRKKYFVLFEERAPEYAFVPLYSKNYIDMLAYCIKNKQKINSKIEKHFGIGDNADIESEESAAKRFFIDL